MLQTFATQSWDETFSDVVREQAVRHLESGQILYFPQLPFALSADEARFLSPEYADPRAKNIGYHPEKASLWGVQRLTEEDRILLKSMLDRFARNALQLVQSLLTRYTNALMMERTSFRPVEISNRKSSYRKDDKRLHVDAFPSAPNQGKRILRVFCNINPHDENRIWKVGEPFEQVVEQFLTRLSHPIPGISAALRFLKITKSYRSPYDHYMLKLHDQMKYDERYQQEAQQMEIHFPPGSTWIVQTDHVSHAALKGQHALEQTFYLPVSAMQDESRAPLRVLERALKRPLV